MPLSPEERRWRRGVANDWRDFCGRLSTIVASCKELGPDIVINARLLEVSADGFPSSTAGSNEKVSGSDAEKTPYSDPTGNVVATEPELVTIERRLHESLAAAYLALQAADRDIVRGRQLLEEPPEPGKPRAPECVNCARWEIYIAATPGKAGRCDDCFDYRDTYRRDAPEKVVRARAVNATPRQMARGASIPPESAAWVADHLSAARNRP